MGTIEAVKLKKGDFIIFQGNISKVARTEFYNPGKGSALMKVRLVNVSSGKTVDNTFKSVEMLESVEVVGRKMQYLYNDGTVFTFMDNTTFDQFEMNGDVIGEPSRFMKEGEEYHVYVSDGVPIDMNWNGNITLEVTKAFNAVKGNSTSNITKKVTLETGAEVDAPAFIRVGDQISINPETGEYRGRVNE
jgi:elongation factor P